MATTMAAPLTSEQVQDRIRAQVARRNIRLKLFFQDFDKLRKGFCNQDKFRSSLSMALYFLNLQFTEEVLAELLNKYRLQTDLIRYQDFIDCIDGVDNNPDYALSSLKKSQMPKSFNPKLEQQMIQLINYYKHIVAIDRVQLKEPFQDFDRSNSCHIKKSQFRRVLDLLKFLPSNDKIFDELCRRYCDNGNDTQVNYVKFLKDIDNVNEILKTLVVGIKPNESSFKPQSKIQDPNSLNIMNTLYIHKQLAKPSLSVPELMQKLKAEIVMKRIRIRQFFLDFDTLRKNIVTKDQFKRIVTNYKLNSLSNDQLDKIAQHFKVSLTDDRVRWMDFCEEVQKIWTQKELQKDPLKRVTAYHQTQSLPARRQPISLSEQQQKQLDAVLQMYRIQISNKRVLIKNHFMDFDVTKQGFISKNQFLRILDMFKIRADERSMALILKKYADKGNLNQINYYDFCKDVDVYNVDGKIISKTHAQAFTDFTGHPFKAQPSIYTSIPNDLSDLLNKLRKKVVQQRIRVSEFLKDFDKLRTGTVPTQQLRQGLNMAKLPLSEKQYHLLQTHFAVDNKPGYIRWKDLMNKIQQKEQKKPLQKYSPVEKPDFQSTNFLYGKQHITKEQDNIAKQVVDRFRQFAQTNRLDIKDSFRTWDKLGRYKVSPKQFRQVLATFNFEMSDAEFQAVSKAYASDDEKQFRYIDFYNDTKPFSPEIGTGMQITLPQGILHPRPMPESLMQVMIQLKKQTKINRIRYKQYFVDFDPLRRGLIKKNKFKGVLTQTLKLHLEEVVLNWLQQHYQDANDKTCLRYQDFLKDIDIVFTKYQLEKDPLEKPPVYDYSRTTFLKDSIQSDKEKFEQLMSRLGQVVFKRRLLLKPFFQDKDKTKSGKVSFTRMRSILDYNKIPLSDQQFDLLCRQFSHESIQFNYVQFNELLKVFEQKAESMKE